MNLLGVFRKKRGVDGGAFDRALAVPVPAQAGEVPFETRLPLPPATAALISPVAFVVGAYGVLGVILGLYTPTTLSVAVMVAAMTLVLGSSLVLGGLNPARRLQVSEEAIRVERLFGSKAVAWWDVTTTRAKPDLSEIRVDANHGGVVIQTSGMDEARRAATLMALRSRLGTAQPVQQWTQSRRSAAELAAAIGPVLLFASLYLGFGTRTLGIRCSGPSSYFDARFDLPPGEQGCVVIRVSGAAARAGVRQGDRMIAMNGAPITSGGQFNARFSDEGGRDFDFTFTRSGNPEPLRIHVALGSRGHPRTPDSDPLAWFLRARGNPDRRQSIEQYSRAIRLAPDFDLAYVFRGELMLDSHDGEAARPDLEHALALNPGSAEANRAMARYYEGQIFVDSAVPKMYMQQAIDLHKCEGGFLDHNLDCSEDYVALADILRFRADTPGSIAAARQAMPYYPKSASPMYQLALSYEIARDREQAELYAREYLARPASQRNDDGSKGMRALLTRLRDAPQ